MKSTLSRLHWPQVYLLTICIVSGCATPIAFLVLVPERLQDKLVNLDWLTILGVGVPALITALSALRAFFVGPVMRPKEPPKT